MECLEQSIKIAPTIYPAGTYLLKVNNRKSRTSCEICARLTVKTSERRHTLF